MDPETTTEATEATEVVEPTSPTKPVEMDGTSFSKGPSKPVPLQPRPRTRPQSSELKQGCFVNSIQIFDTYLSLAASDVTDSKPEETTNGKHDRNSAPPNMIIPDEVDSSKSSPKDKRGSLESFKKFFTKSGSKSGKKGMVFIQFS